MQRHRAGIVGVTGYGGAELTRLLLAHPKIELTLTATRSGDGRPLAAAHPHLRAASALTIEKIPEAGAPAWEALDAVFFALPHGESQRLVGRVPARVTVVDLGADHRADAGWIYGLPEVNSEWLAGATRIAAPGCFATAIQLGLYPLARAGLLLGDVIVDAKTGSSGAGASPGKSTHHPERAHGFFAYKLLQHQHEAEILATLRRVAPAWDGELSLQTHATPLVRGIFASIYVQIPAATSDEEIATAFAGSFRGKPFVRLVDGSPDVAWVAQSNFADVGWARRGRRLAVFVALDNLMKGAAGQAVQCLNLSFGLPETEGLAHWGGFPA